MPHPEGPLRRWLFMPSHFLHTTHMVLSSCSMERYPRWIEDDSLDKNNRSGRANNSVGLWHLNWLRVEIVGSNNHYLLHILNISPVMVIAPANSTWWSGLTLFRTENAASVQATMYKWHRLDFPKGGGWPVYYSQMPLHLIRAKLCNTVITSPLWSWLNSVSSSIPSGGGDNCFRNTLGHIRTTSS